MKNLFFTIDKTNFKEKYMHDKYIYLFFKRKETKK